MRWAKWASVRKSDHRRSPTRHPLMDTNLKESGTSGLHSVISTAKKATLYASQRYASSTRGSS